MPCACGWGEPASACGRGAGDVLGDVAPGGAQGGAAADRVAGRLTQHEVEVGAVGTVGRVARQSELLAGIPPPVLPDDDLWVEAVVELRPCLDAAVGSVQPD